MRLHHITIANFRGVDRFDIAFAADGVTIVEGDNEIGKSCIPEALQLVLGTLDSARSRAVKDVKPVHRDVGPEVAVDISTGPYRFVLEKRWLRQASTTLAVSSPHREQLTGREAHERVQQILDETMDHDLWSALNVRQGGDLSLPNFNVPALGRALDAAAGGDITTSRHDDLWERIVAERSRYWTATGKAKSDRIALADELARARGDVDAIAAVIAEMEGDVAEVERIDASLPELTTQLDEFVGIAADLDERWRAAQLAAAALREAKLEYDSAVSARDHAAEKRDERQALIADVARAESSVTAIEDEQGKAAPAARAAQARLDGAIAAVEVARTDHAAAEAAFRLAASDTTHLRQKIEISQSTERLDLALDAEDRLHEAQKVIDRIKVTPELLQKLETHHVDVIRADAALGRGVAVVRAEALASTQVTIDGIVVELGSGETHESKVSGDLHLEILGTLRVVISAGSDSQDLAAEADRLRNRYDEACHEVGVADVVEARARLAERQAAEQAAGERRETIKAALRDLTPDALASKIASLGNSILEYEQTRLAEPGLPESPEAAQDRERAAADEVDDRSRELSALETERIAAADDLQQIGIDAATSTATLGAAQQALENLKRRLTDARTHLADDTLEAHLAQAERNLTKAFGVLDGANRRIADEDLEMLGQLIGRAKAATARISEEIAANRQRRTEARIRLELRSNDGLQHQLDRAQTEVAHLERDHVSLERRADAALLLHDVAAQCREEIRRRYHEPFRQQIERLGSILVGRTFEVELDEDLRIARRTLRGITLGFGQLSAGTREQLGIISRLACATIVSEHGGAPVILDDTLGWTDPTRLDGMGAIIAEAGKDCQVIVLTCTPGRYASVEDADIVRLANSPAILGLAG